MPLPRFLAPNHDRYEGVRPIQIYLLRTLYFLMAAFVATEAWCVILTHQGPSIGYKSLWLAAWPLWRAGILAGNPAEEMTQVFLWTPVAIAAVPWGYVLRHYVLPARTRVA